MIQITPAARDKIQEFVAADIVREPALRITLDGSAQTPLARSYSITLVDKEDRERTEIAVNVDGIRIFLNLDTSNLLSGALVDWVEEDGESGFRVTDPNAVAAPPKRDTSDLPISGPLADRVQQVIDEVINPGIAAHGGFVELVDVGEDSIFIRMGGGCQGCAASQATLRMGIERMVREHVPEIQHIMDVTDHTAGVNPYY